MQLFKQSRILHLIKSLPMRSLLTALLLLVSGLVVTAQVTLNIKADLEADAQQEFDFASDQITQEVTARFNAHAQILQSGAALFAASDKVTRQEWQDFAQHLSLESQFPGIQGLGYAAIIPAALLPEHLQKIRAEGFPDYKVWPQDERDLYTSIIYLEPFSDRNLRAFGYDMFTETVRRTAMERARDSNSAALSGKVALVQENGQDVQAGTLLYVPVYQHGLPIETIAQRRAALQGWVYSPYRMNDLMGGISGDWGAKTGKMIRLEIFDSDLISPASLLYNSQPDKIADLPVGQAFTRVAPIDFAGRQWNLRFTQLGTPASILDYGKVWMSLVGGTLISLLLFGLLLSMLTLRVNAFQMATRMTTELRASEEKFRVIINSADDVVFTLDHEQRWNGVFGHWPEKMGRTPEYFLGHTSHEISGEGDENFRDRFEANQRALAGEIAEYEMVMHAGEQTRFFHMVVSPLINESGVISGALSLGRDVTELKHVDEALRESERFSRNTLDSLAMEIAILDETGSIVKVNRAWRNLSEAEGPLSVNVCEGANYLAVCDATQGPDEVFALAIAAGIRSVINGAQLVFSFEYPCDSWPAACVEKRWFSVHVTRFEGDGPIRVVVTHENITVRRVTEARLQDTERRMNILAEYSRAITWEVDAGGLYTFISPTCLSILGYSPEEIVGKKHFYDLHPEEERAAFKAAAFEFFDRRVDFRNLENSLQSRDVRIIWVSTNALPILDENGKLTGYRGVDTDITERKHSDQSLAKIAARLSLAVRAGGVGTWDYDLINDRLIWDDQMYRLYGLAPQDFSGAYAAWQQGFHPQDRERGDNEIQAARRGEKEFDTEFRVVWPDGSVHAIRALALVQRNTAGEPLSMLGTNWDVTDQKLMLIQLQTSVVEKDALLREVHHRVKNNLAAISGLIGLQESNLIDPVSKAAFNELGSRVSAMALVHELLYSSETLVSIDLQTYLEKLTAQLSHLYQTSGQTQITVAAHGVWIDLDEAIPCGLIVTEQITNSFKYAFPGGQPRPGEDICEIKVSASQNGSAYTLKVSDNGVGLPAGFDWKKSPTLGMSLIRMLGEHQLGASIHLDTALGTCIELKFDKKHRSNS